MQRLTIRNGTGGFLQTDHLTVCKLAAVVHEGHCADGGANVAGTSGGLFDFAAVDLDLYDMQGGETPGKGDFHVRDDWCPADDKAFDADQLVAVYAVLEAKNILDRNQAYRLDSTFACSLREARTVELCRSST